MVMFHSGMKSYAVAAMLILSAVVWLGCISEDEGKIGVIVTIVPQESMVKAIGGDKVKVTTMVPAGQSPHGFEPTPGQLVDVARADIYFKVGSGVEFELSHMEVIKEQNPDMTVVDCSEGIKVVSIDAHYRGDSKEENDTHAGEDETEGNAHGHGSGTKDPHIWLSPANFRKMAEHVWKGLAELDPDNEDLYKENYDSYKTKLNALHENASEALAPYRGRSFLVYHPSWGYFGDAYDLEQLPIEEEGNRPGPKGIAAVIEQAKK